MVLASLCAACAPTISAPLGKDAPAREQLDAGYALVFELMGEERKVAEILGIKSVSAETKLVIKDISAAAESAYATLKGYQQADNLTMSDTHLPVIETSARNHIKNITTVSLLTSSGHTFQTRLLITQVKATQYAGALFHSLAAADHDGARRKWLGEEAKRWEALAERVERELVKGDEKAQESGSTE